MSIELHIERLVIDEALLGGERAANVRAAIERELTRRLAPPGAAVTLRDLGTVAELPPASLSAATYRHEPLGSRIATVVQSSLGLSPARSAGKEH
jgi:hypothetical protein